MGNIVVSRYATSFYSLTLSLFLVVKRCEGHASLLEFPDLPLLIDLAMLLINIRSLTPEVCSVPLLNFRGLRVTMKLLLAPNDWSFEALSSYPSE